MQLIEQERCSYKLSFTYCSVYHPLAYPRDRLPGCDYPFIKNPTQINRKSGFTLKVSSRNFQMKNLLCNYCFQRDNTSKQYKIQKVQEGIRPLPTPSPAPLPKIFPENLLKGPYFYFPHAPAFLFTLLDSAPIHAASGKGPSIPR